MFDVGFSELVLLFLIGLLILGPERLPKVASQIGRWVGRARRTANQLRHQLEREIALNEVGNPPKWQPPPKKPGSSASETAGEQTSTEADSSGQSDAATGPAATGPDGASAASEAKGGASEGEPPDPQRQ